MSLLTRFAETYDYNYSSSYNDGVVTGSSGGDPAAIAAIFAMIIIPMIIFIILCYVVGAIFGGMIFKKAGVESWKAWVPFYNTWVMLEIGGQKGYWVLFSFIPLLNIVTLVFGILAAINIGKSLGKETWFVLLYFFVPFVWLIWLGLDKSTWTPVSAATVAQLADQPPVAPQDAPPTPPTDPTPPTPPVNPLVQ